MEKDREKSRKKYSRRSDDRRDELNAKRRHTYRMRNVALTDVDVSAAPVIGTGVSDVTHPSDIGQFHDHVTASLQSCCVGPGGVTGVELPQTQVGANETRVVDHGLEGDQLFDSGLWQPDDPTHGIEENDLDRMDPDDCDVPGVYEDDEARVFHDRDFQYAYRREPGMCATQIDPYDYVYGNLPKKHHVLGKAKNCEFCRAKRFPGEGPAFCCKKGLVHIFIPEVPAKLRCLFSNQRDKDAKYFRKHIRYFNSHFSFTSFGVSIDQGLANAKGTGVCCFKAHGQPTLLTSRPDHDGSGVERSIREGTFGLHDILKSKSFCVHHESLQNKIWVGGKDDWVVVTDIRTRRSAEIVNLISGETVSLPALTTISRAEMSEYLDVGETTEREMKYSKMRFRKVVLCQTPSNISGYIAIAPIILGWIAYTTSSDTVWKLLANPLNLSGKFTFPYFFMDALIHKGRILAVDIDGFVFSWDMVNHCEQPLEIEPPNFSAPDGSGNEIWYLAKSPSDEILLICLHVKFATYYKHSSRLIQGELQDRVDKVHGMTLFKIDVTDSKWERIHEIGLGHSLFIGMNYPFFGTWSGVDPNSVYVANLAEWDVMILDMKAREDAGFKGTDYPVENDKRLCDRFSMRTPMWFRPTRPSRRKIEY
ncbi:unnamed protein product [Urochloa humidicola]